MPRLINVTNSLGRDARVPVKARKAIEPVRLGLPGVELSFRRYLASTQAGLHEELVKVHGEDYADALVAGDPETDLEHVGRALGPTSTVFLSGEGDILHAPPEVLEVLLDPFGRERERRPPREEEANVNDALPVRWRKRTLPRRELVRRFAIKRTLQLRHDSGITYDYLFAMAKELDAADVVVHVGAGEAGREPLRFAQNGAPFQGFLEGRVDGDRYQLLLHLSELELRAPPPPPEAGEPAAEGA